MQKYIDHWAHVQQAKLQMKKLSFMFYIKICITIINTPLSYQAQHKNIILIWQ